MKQRQGGLNIRVELSNGHLIDLEMQIANEHNWPERSISYAARSFDNLNAGDDYVNVSKHSFMSTIKTKTPHFCEV